MLESFMRGLKRVTEKGGWGADEEVFEWKNGVAFRLERRESGKLHALTIFLDGRQAGYAWLWETGKDTMHVQRIDIAPGFQDERLGSNLIEQVNFMLREYFKKEGTLSNTIDPGSKRGLYERHGWKYIEPNSNLMQYNKRPRAWWRK